jgi:3-dehydroquinate dehydratase
MLVVRRASQLHLLKLQQQCMRAAIRNIYSTDIDPNEGITSANNADSRGASDAAIAGLNNEIASYLGPLGDIDDADDLNRMTMADLPAGLLQSAKRSRHSAAYSVSKRSPIKAVSSAEVVLVIHGAACFIGGRLADTSRLISESTVSDLIDNTAAELGLECIVVSSNSDAELIDAVCAADYAAIVVNPAGSSSSLQYALQQVQCPVITVNPGAAAPHWQLNSSAVMPSIAGCGPYSYALGLHAAAQALAAEDDETA